MTVQAWLSRLADEESRVAYLTRYASPLVRHEPEPVSADELAARLDHPALFAKADDAVEAELRRIGAMP